MALVLKKKINSDLSIAACQYVEKKRKAKERKENKTLFHAVKFGQECINFNYFSFFKSPTTKYVIHKYNVLMRNISYELLKFEINSTLVYKNKKLK